MAKLKKDGVTPKNSGGKRREGITQEPMTFKISKENKTYLVEYVGNKNAFVNMLIEEYRKNHSNIMSKVTTTEKEQIINFLKGKGFEELEKDSWADNWHNVVFDEDGSVVISDSQGYINPINSYFELVGIYSLKYGKITA